VISKAYDRATGEYYSITGADKKLKPDEAKTIAQDNLRRGGKHNADRHASTPSAPDATAGRLDADAKITDKNKRRAARSKKHLPNSTKTKNAILRDSTGTKQNPKFKLIRKPAVSRTGTAPPKKTASYKTQTTATPKKTPAFMGNPSRRLHSKAGGTTVTTQQATPSTSYLKGRKMSGTSPNAQGKVPLKDRLKRAGDHLRPIIDPVKRHLPDSQTVGQALDELSHSTGARTAKEGGDIKANPAYQDPKKAGEGWQGKPKAAAEAGARRFNETLREPTSAKSGPQNVRRLAGAARHYDITPGKAARAAFGPQGRRIAGGVAGGTLGAVGAIKGRKKRAAEQAVKDKPWKALPKLKGKTGMVLGAGTATAALGAGAVKVNETQQKRKQLSNDLKWN
jgi:hypothetical protein